MFGNKSGNKKAQTGSSKDRGTTLIAANAVITGDVAFSDELIVSGTVRGNIAAEEGSNATLVITQSGVIEGDVRVPAASVSGVARGDLFVDGILKVAAGACITGNVYYDEIEMARGATIQGSMVHKEAVAPAEAGVDPITSDQPRESGEVLTLQASGE